MIRLLAAILRTLGRILLGAILWLLLVQVAVRLVRRYLHFPVPAFVAARLNNPIRRALQPPEQVVEASGIRPGMTVLELGPGPGTFTLEAARRVGPDGRVIAVDVEARMISILQRAVAAAELSNVEAHVADAYRLPVPDASVDLAFMVTVLAEIPDRQRALAELKRVLKPEGNLSVTEAVFDPDYPRASTVTRWCEEAGFRLVDRTMRGLWYTLQFRAEGEQAGATG